MPIPPIVVVRTRVSTSSNLDFSKDVKCYTCGARFKARVEASATGSSRTGLFTSREQAREIAGLAAFERAHAHAEKLISLAPCPDCQKTFGGFGAALSAALPVAFLASVFSSILFVSMPLLIVPGVGLVGLISLAVLMQLGKNRAAAVVRLERLVEVPAEFVERRREALARGSDEEAPAPVKAPRRALTPPDFGAPVTTPEPPSQPGELEFSSAPDDGEAIELDLDRSHFKKHQQ